MPRRRHDSARRPGRAARPRRRRPPHPHDPLRRAARAGSAGRCGCRRRRPAPGDHRPRRPVGVPRADGRRQPVAPGGPDPPAGRRDQLPHERDAGPLGGRAPHPRARASTRATRPSRRRWPRSAGSAGSASPGRSSGCASSVSPVDDVAAALDPTETASLGRPTVARLLQAKGHVTSVEDGFARYLGRGRPAYVPREGIGPLEAIRAIRAAGGLAVLAHFSEAAERRRDRPRAARGGPRRPGGLLPDVRPGDGRCRRGRRGRARTRRHGGFGLPWRHRPVRRGPRRAVGPARGRRTTRDRARPRRRPPVPDQRVHRPMTRHLPILELVPPPTRRARRSPAERAGRRAADRVPARLAGAAELPHLDARLPDEPERLGGDGRATARRRLRRGAEPRGRRPRRDQHLRDPRGCRAEGDRPAGSAQPAQGRQPRPAGRSDRLLRP